VAELPLDCQTPYPTSKETLQSKLISTALICQLLPKSSEGLKENSSFLKPRPYFLFEIRLSAHREQFGEDRRPLRAI